MLPEIPKPRLWNHMPRLQKSLGALFTLHERDLEKKKEIVRKLERQRDNGVDRLVVYRWDNKRRNHQFQSVFFFYELI